MQKLTVKDLKTFCDNMQASALNRRDKELEKINFLDTKFDTDAYRWNLANKIINEILTLGTNRQDTEEI